MSLTVLQYTHVVYEMYDSNDLNCINNDKCSENTFLILGYFNLVLCYGTIYVVGKADTKTSVHGLNT